MRVIRALAAAALATAFLVGAGQAPRAAAGELPSATAFFNHPDSLVNKWVAANTNDSRRARIASRIASQPQGVWFSRYTPGTVTEDVRKITSAASAKGQVPVLVAYQLPNRDCGGASAGGAPDLASYDAWMRGFAAGLGSGPSVVILEPDSIALISCLSPAELSGRYASLARASAAIHAAAPKARVYFDAGHSAWNSPAVQASRLRSAGVLSSGDGIYSNVSNYRRTADEAAFAKAVLAQLGGSSGLTAVIDTSRNGNGPAPGDAWCDPRGRKVGENPTAGTGDPAIDAYLWIKPPGELDGCAGAAGSFSPDYAYEMAG
ncbi:glycoside hydrolase family 6 protein [Streptomyces sp. NPDC007983]|uniref:glycoside hydrolase family 6 protein n=1 Tax=Streptomyces sp. NPDC007983 TaxID=3364800 RepID=UPI0036F18227